MPELNEDTSNPEIDMDSNLDSDELNALKDKARLLGVIFSNNIGIDTLRNKIRDKQKQLEEEDNKETVYAAKLLDPTEVGDEPKPVKEKTLRQYLLDTATKLIRIRVTCMNPNKASLHGEFFTVANEYLGTVKKFVPFGEATDNGYHVPYCIYKMLLKKKFLQIKTFTNKQTKQIVTNTEWVREFAIEVLPPLTRSELTKLAATQSASGSLRSE